MNPVVLVPFRGGEPFRERSWAYLRKRWEGYGLRVFEGTGPPGDFNKSAAVNEAAHKAGRGPRDWDVAIIPDADVIIPERQVRAGLEMALSTGHALWPFQTFYRLTAKGSLSVMAGGPVRHRFLAAQSNNVPGAAVVVTRALWERIGGMDERFRGWGGEDNALLHALTVLGGKMIRASGQSYHLWHPKAGVGPDYHINAQLARRYKQARTPVLMRQLIAERLPGAVPLLARHQGETATIIGKGPSLLEIRREDVRPGPVIALNSAIVQVRRLGLPNPIYSMQKDMGVVPPIVPETLILSSAQSWDAWPDYPLRHVINIEAEFDMRWGAMSSPMAVELARVMGCTTVRMLGHDGYTRRIADKVENDRIVRVRPGGYHHHAGVEANRRAIAAGLAIEWVA